MAGLCLKRVPLEQSIRLLGVRVGSLVHWDAATQQAGAEVHASVRKPLTKGDPFSLPLFD